ncbi:hypothetical protein [Caulobacter mirabilis]|nr:hypothetical protein [Caulobacter mirabilis]
MRAAATVLLTVVLAGPALAQADPAWERQRAAALQAQRDAERDALAWRLEAEARRQRAQTEATLRSMPSDALAGGPSATLPRRAPSTIEMAPPPERPTPALTADQARMDALMAEAMARSNARVKAIAGSSDRR